MKTLFIISHLSPGGPVNALLSIVQGFNEIGKDEITILTLRTPDIDTLKDAFKKKGVILHNIQTDSLLTLPYNIFRLRKFIKYGGFDVVSSTGIRADGMLAISTIGLKNINIFTTVQNIPSEDLTYTYPRLRGKLASSLHYSILRRFGRNVIGVSNAVCDDMMSKLGVKATRILNPVEFTKYTVFDTNRSPIVIYAASLSLRKNPVEAISFFINAGLPANYELHVYGTGPLEYELKNRFHAENSIHWCGFSNQLSSIFGASSIYVSASLSEGLPLTAQLALICGCPCVLSDIPQHQEILKLSRFVYLYKSGVQEDFTRALFEALKVRREAACSEGIELSKKISPLVTATSLRNFYQSPRNFAK